MKYFPMFLKMEGRKIVIFGGGEQAAQKCRLALKTEAEVVIVGNDLDEELQDLVSAGSIVHWREGRTETLFAEVALVFVATGCAGADTGYAAVAKAYGVPVNVVDRPDLCDAVTPAIVDRDPVVVAIGTEGTAPVLTRQIKTLVEQALEPRLGELAALAGRLRRAAAAKLSPRQRRDFWRWAFDGPARRAFAAGKEREALRMIKAALEEGGSIGAGEGFVSLVGAGPGSRDLITLRGVQRLQEADIIFYDRLIDDGLLELARRDAERVFVGKRPGSTDWPQEKINGLIVAAARQGKRVVRLKCGDPGVFARGVQEADVLNKADIGWEIVPGVTAASAASAVIDGFLTERGKLDTLVLSTGQTAKDGCYPAWAHHLQPGVTLALYMAVSKAREIQKQLIASGVDLDLPVDVVSKAATADQTVLSTTIGQMVEDLEESSIENPAVIFIRNRLTDGGRVPAPPATLNAVTLRAAQFPMFVHEGLPQVVNERR